MSDIRNRIFCGSAAKMDMIPDESIDFIFVDLPFNIDIGKRTKSRNKGYDGKSYEDDDGAALYMNRIGYWTREAYRVLKPTGSMVLFSGWNYLLEVMQGVEFGEPWYRQGHVIIKYPFGIYTKKRYVSSHYHVLWYTKHKSEWTFNKTKNYQEDVMDLGSRDFKAKKLGHPCPTTVRWVEEFVNIHSNPGDLVLDFCMGAGGTAIACLNTGRNYVGVEIDSDFVEIARRRVEEYDVSK
jgi:site-specific DNA-methyltransferase (adenine-specific)